MHARDGCVDAGPFAVAGEEKGQRVARVQCCVYAAAVSGMGFVGLGKCGVVGVWLDKVLRPRLGNEGLEQGMMMGWNAVLGGSDEGACLWEKHGCLVTKLGGLGMQ